MPVSEATFAGLVLIMSRLTGVFLVEPFFGSRTIPMKVKAILILALSVMMMGLVKVPPEATRLDWVFVIRIAYEVLVGLAIGFLFLAVFLAIQSAGSFVDLEMGFGLSQAIDPSGGVQGTVLSRFYYMLALVLFLMVNGQQLMVMATVGSFNIFPAGSMSLPTALAPAAVGMLADVLFMAVKIAGPVVGALFIADIVFGVVARAVPQMNIFVVGFPVKILLGLVAVAVTLPFTVKFFQDLFSQLEHVLARTFA